MGQSAAKLANSASLLNRAVPAATSPSCSESPGMMLFVSLSIVKVFMFVLLCSGGKPDTITFITSVPGTCKRIPRYFRSFVERSSRGRRSSETGRAARSSRSAGRRVAGSLRAGL